MLSVFPFPSTSSLFSPGPSLLPFGLGSPLFSLSLSSLPSPVLSSSSSSPPHGLSGFSLSLVPPHSSLAVSSSTSVSSVPLLLLITPHPLRTRIHSLVVTLDRILLVLFLFQREEAMEEMTEESLRSHQEERENTMRRTIQLLKSMIILVRVGIISFPS